MAKAISLALDQHFRRMPVNQRKMSKKNNQVESAHCGRRRRRSPGEIGLGKPFQNGPGKENRGPVFLSLAVAGYVYNRVESVCPRVPSSRVKRRVYAALGVEWRDSQETEQNGCVRGLRARPMMTSRVLGTGTRTNL